MKPAGRANFTKYGPGASEIPFVSVSIDPEHDSPERLKAFLSGGLK